jgi:uncharacterized protein YgbK (DUF1537 family)
MLPIAVIADDLTGAADTGIQFCRVFRPAYLAGSHALDQVRFPDSPGVLAVYTNSRNLTVRAAGESVRSTMQYVNRLQPQSIYKKIDSCLRGNIGAEIDAVLEVSGCKISFVSPAFPAQGRTTIHGLHYLHGIPLAETEMAQDPVSPVTESNLPKLLADQSRFKVGRIDVDILEQSDNRVKAEVEHCIKNGCRHIVFDADTQEHLDKVAQLAVTIFPKTLLVGSAGLAAGMAAVFSKGVSQRPFPKINVDGSMLWVCGSASERLAGQARLLIEKGGLPKISPAPAMLAEPDQISGCRQLADDAVTRLAQKGLVLQIGHVADGKNVFSAEDVLDGFSRLVGEIVTRFLPAGLFLSGGDTADAILQVIGTQFIILKNEVLPGLIGGILSGGLMDGKPVVTKAGAFGNPDDLVEIYRRLKNERNTT